MAPRKKTRAKLRELAETAYRRELDRELHDLAGCFKRWEAGDLDCFELGAKIHDFHDGASRRLYVLYDQMDAGFAVGRGVALGLLPVDEIPPALLPELQSKIDLCREMEVN